jgi:hypothetical protein
MIMVFNGIILVKMASIVNLAILHNRVEMELERNYLYPERNYISQAKY